MRTKIHESSERPRIWKNAIYIVSNFSWMTYGNNQTTAFRPFTAPISSNDLFFLLFSYGCWKISNDTHDSRLWLVLCLWWAAVLWRVICNPYLSGFFFVFVLFAQFWFKVWVGNICAQYTILKGEKKSLRRACLWQCFRTAITNDQSESVSKQDVRFWKAPGWPVLRSADSFRCS